MNAHNPWDLKQMQSLPLEAKIEMTKARIRVWYDSWTKFEIYDKATGKTRFTTIDTRAFLAEPPMEDTEYIESACEGQVYVSFSGGKDSTVLKHIVDSMYDDVPAVFVNTGLEYPEIQKFVRDIKAGKWDCFNSDVEILRPEMRFDEVVKMYGYPVISKNVSEKIYYAQQGTEYGKKAMRGQDKNGNPSEWRKQLIKYSPLVDSGIPISNICCRVMKKSPAKKMESATGRKAIIGTLAQESALRKQAWVKNGCNAFASKRPISQPLSFWTEQDILHYIKKYNVPYCPVYGDIRVKQSEETDKDQINLIDYLQCYEESDILETSGYNRTGCIFCMFGCHLEKEPNRFQRLKETHPRQWEYCIKGGEMVDGKWQPSKDGLGLGHVLDFIGVKYE